MTDERPPLVRLLRLPSGGAPDPLPAPAYQSEGAAGFDLRAALRDELVLGPGERALVPTGFALALPEGYEGQVRPRSGLALHHGVTVLNAPGTVDADFRGELAVVLINHGREPFAVRRGDRIAQVVVARAPRADLREVDALEPTARGAGGYGSTGRR